jgi:hypothetical protein
MFFFNIAVGIFFVVLLLAKFNLFNKTSSSHFFNGLYNIFCKLNNNSKYKHTIDDDLTSDTLTSDTLTSDDDSTDYKSSDETDDSETNKDVKNETTNDNESTDNESTDNESTDNESTDNESTDNESTDNESTDSESTDNESTDNESTDNESTDSETDDNVSTDIETDDNEITDGEKDVKDVKDVKDETDVKDEPMEDDTTDDNEDETTDDNEDVNNTDESGSDLLLLYPNMKVYDTNYINEKQETVNQRMKNSIKYKYDPINHFERYINKISNETETKLDDSIDISKTEFENIKRKLLEIKKPTIRDLNNLLLEYNEYNYTQYLKNFMSLYGYKIPIINAKEKRKIVNYFSENLINFSKCKTGKVPFKHFFEICTTSIKDLGLNINLNLEFVEEYLL